MKCLALGCLNVKGHEGPHIGENGTWDTRPCAVQYKEEEHIAYGCYLALGHSGPHQIRVIGETINWYTEQESVSLKASEKT